MNIRPFAAVASILTLWLGLSITFLAVETGCKTANQNTYRASGVAAVTVDAAMKAWGDFVGKTHPGAATEAKVKVAYEAYQKSISTVADTARAWLTAKANNSPGAAAAQATFNNAIAASAVALSDLETLITSLGVKL